MQSFDFKKFLPHLLIVVGFAVLSLIYCYPALQGKMLHQGDNVSWKAMAHEGMQWHEKTGENVMWSNSMFGGMPTFTYYVPESNNFIFPIQTFITNLLAKPAYFLFLAMLCFYVLMRIMKVDKWLSAVGALAYAFCTFNIGIIVAGHETEMLSIAYMPAVLGGLFLIYREKWWTGAPLMGIALALMISNGHYQILYYLAIVIVFAVVGMFIIALKENRIKQFFLASVVSLVTAIIALGPSMPGLLTTSEYAKETMRGGNSELTGHDKGKKAGGLDKDYAFTWSNSIGETFCLMVPYLYGGSSDEPLEAAPRAAELAGGQIERVPLYWGPQPFLAGPVYLGAIVCFLFVLGLLVIRSKHKWWVIAVCILAICMSWGKNFAGLNYLLFDTLPMLNKFRTPTMILVIPELLFPFIGIWALQEIISGHIGNDELWKKVKIAVIATAGVCVVLALGSSMFFSFTYPEVDSRYPAEFLKALKEDRSALAVKSCLTSAVYILLAAGVIWAYIKNKIKANVLIAGIGLLVAVDLISTATRYMNSENYQDESDYEANFQPRPVDQQVMQDKDPYYRVLDVSRNTYNDALQAYFHKCIGGYSPAKLEIYQDLIDRQLNTTSGKLNAQVLNMLNTKYIIFPAQGGQPAVQLNNQACGNAWFVNEIKWANTADDEMQSLNANFLGDTAKVVTGNFDPKKTAIVRSTFKNELNGYNFGKDSAAYVKLAKYGLNNISFTSSNTKDGFAVFSDIWYPKDWIAEIDGKPVTIIKANYVLRALKIPAGQHKIDFHFRPKSFEKGNTIALISSILLFGMVIAGLYPVFRNKKEQTADTKKHD